MPMADRTFIDWLDTAAARRRLGARPWRPSPPGQAALLEALERAEQAGDNLSLGLFRGRGARAHLLAWIERAPNADPCVRLVQLRAPRAHPQDGPRLLAQLAWLLRDRDDLSSLEVHATDDGELLRALGHEPAATAAGPAQRARADVRALLLAMLDTDGPQPLDLQRVRHHDDPGGAVRVGVVESTAAWDRLRPAWNGLLAATPGATVFQSFEFLRAWWSHLGWSDRLYIVVVERAGVPVAIAPLQVTRQRWLGFWFETLIYLGQPPESDRPMVLRHADDPRCLDYVVEYLAAESHRWQQLILREQLPDDPFGQRMLERFRSKGWLTAATEGPTCPVVAVDGSWTAYLATRPKAFRKSLRRKNSALAEAGTVQLDAAVAPGDGLSRYLAVEQRSWKADARRVGVAQSAAHLSFYRALARNCADTLGLRFRFLAVEGQDVAATFGLLWRDRLYSLHIAHDSGWDRHSPGVVLTALELQQGFDGREYAVFDFLSGILPNKGSWSTTLLPTADLHFDRRNLRGVLHHVVEFRLRPPAKRLLARTGLLPRVLRWKERLYEWLD